MNLPQCQFFLNYSIVKVKRLCTNRKIYMYHKKYQSSSTHCSKVISKVYVNTVLQNNRLTEKRNDRMTDICNYRFQFCTKKNKLIIQKFLRKYDKVNTFMSKNIRKRQKRIAKLCEKNADRIYAVFICMMQTTFIPALSLENLVK